MLTNYDPLKDIIVASLDPVTGESRLVVIPRPPQCEPSPLIVQKIVERPLRVEVTDPTLADYHSPKVNHD